MFILFVIIAPFKTSRYKILRELKKIKIAWPGLNYSTGKGVLMIAEVLDYSAEHLLARTSAGSLTGAS